MFASCKVTIKRRLNFSSFITGFKFLQTMYPLIAQTGLDCLPQLLLGIQNGEGHSKQWEQHMQNLASVKILESINRTASEQSEEA